ncbi:uncharacterized protein ARMOST_18864 [Armillaria ostoyae]|uniref:Uncharacterized protein n=1 Tax=Armillaria ostoyae TaxID=47428 RepID=A0A284S2X9_ARMOS|nr:uncharacterized protein ARMOST_18864 [Armillaria ostoyae]
MPSQLTRTNVPSRQFYTQVELSSKAPSHQLPPYLLRIK